jgi:hypothetical protein
VQGLVVGLGEFFALPIEFEALVGEGTRFWRRVVPSVREFAEALKVGHGELGKVHLVCGAFSHRTIDETIEWV